jgi:hypothetical protein
MVVSVVCRVEGLSCVEDDTRGSDGVSSRMERES